MKHRTKIITAISVLIIVTVSCMRNNSTQQQSDPHKIKTNVFDIKRGVNISHWLSQSDRRGEERKRFITEKDIDLIDSVGYDHIRFPVDEEQLWDEEGNKEKVAFELLHQGIEWALERNLKVIVDLHIIRSHYFNRKNNTLWTNPLEQQKFIDLWKQLSAELGKYDTDLVAYELMNEAVADNPDDWNNLVKNTLSQLRELEPERIVVIGSNKWQSVDTFNDLKVPENDTNIILSFHFYTPFLLTHHQAGWTKIGEYKGPVHYPGKTIKDEDLSDLPENLLTAIQPHNQVYTKDTLQKLISQPIAYAQQRGYQLYCGEWGCLATVPDDMRMQWYNDVREILEKNDIAWANWDYKGSFGIVDKDRNLRQKLIDELLK